MKLTSIEEIFGIRGIIERDIFGLDPLIGEIGKMLKDARVIKT